MKLEVTGEMLWLLLFLPLFLLCSLRLLPGLFLLIRERERKKAGIKDTGEQMKPAQAAAASLAASVGIGNIVGTSQAITMGGPGAVFWMWIAAILGFSVKAGEIWFGQAYGGAAGIIRRALGTLPARFYALLAVLSSLLVGNMAQMNASMDALCHLVPESSMTGRLLLGSALMILATCSIAGGEKALGSICQILVPIMALLYCCCAAIVVFSHVEPLSALFSRIFSEAFRPKAALGAAGGLGLRSAMLWGLRRGTFSHESGLGSAATIHSTVHSDCPRRHALWGIAENSVDTLLLCTVSALVVLGSGAEIPYGTLPGSGLIMNSFSVVFGQGRGSGLLALILLCFGFSTVLGCYIMGSRCAAWIQLKEKSFRCVFLACSALGCLLPVGLIWRAADAVNVLLAVPNLLSLILLAPLIGRNET